MMACYSVNLSFNGLLVSTIGSVQYIRPLSHFVSLQVLPASFCEYVSLLSCCGLSFMSDDSKMLRTNSVTSVLI